MTDASLAFLKKLIATVSPSGFEQEAAGVWRAEAETFADRVWADTHGNSFAVANEGGKPTIMLAGHIDEIGFMVTYIDDKGFLSFAAIGGFDLQVLPGQRVCIRGRQGPLLGVIGRKAIHLMTEEDRKAVVKIEDLWIDIGAKDKKEAQSLVGVGDCAVIAGDFQTLRNDILVARGFDDRVGAFVVLEALRLAAKMNLHAAVVAVATVQEEVGLRGATTSAFGLDPEIGIAVDVTHVTDTPAMDAEKKKIGEAVLGGGPALARGANINPRVFELLVKTARDKNIPCQIGPAPRGTGTDANAIQLTRAGVATALVSVPNRYMHSPCELVNARDLDGCSALIAATIGAVDEHTELIP